MLLHPSARFGRISLLVSVSALAMALATSPASAQQAEPDSVFQMLGRIIFGTGTPKLAIDTPQAVTVIEQEELDRDQPSNITDLFTGVPGVQGTGASARPLGQSFNIRGIGNAEQTASAARIIVTVDGAPKFFEQYRMGSFFGDLDLYKRVEVLRGPASSTLYGSGAIGGVVAFTTKDASDFLVAGADNALQVKLGYDSNGDTLRAGAIYATRQGNAEYLLALNNASGGDMVDGAGEIIPGTAFNSMSGLLKGTWVLGDDADQSITFSMSRTDSDLDDTAVAQTGGAAASQFGTADIHTIDDTVSLTYNNAASDNPWLNLTAQLSYTDTTADKDNFLYGFLCAPGRNAVLCDSSYGYSTTSLKVENTADLSTGLWENYLIAGVQWTGQERTASSSVGDLAFHPEGTADTTGVYLQGEFVWNEKLTLIPGLRADFSTITPGRGAVLAGSTPQSDTAVSPKLGAMYQVTDSFALFGTLAKTERMPTLDELYSSEAASSLPARTPSLNLEKEQATTVELGFTWQSQGLLQADDSLQIKATAFNNDLTNMIAATPRVVGGVAVPYFSNIDSAQIWGGEVEAFYDADRWFSQLAYSNVRSKDNATGLTLADTPAENVVLTVGAKFPVQNMTIGWRGSYFDAITTSSTTTSAPSYDTQDVFVTWAPEEGGLAGFQVNLMVENIWDAEYRNNLSLDNAPGRNTKLTVAKIITF